MVITNIYAPNQDSPEFFMKALDVLTNWDVSFKYIGGDFNLYLDPKRDAKGIKSWSSKNSAQMINSFLEEHNWVDSWRMLHPETFQFTWKTKSPLRMSRLDYFLVPVDMASSISKCEILPTFLSDHCPVELELDSETQMKGRGFWKFNISMLSDKNFLDSVNETIDFAEFRYSEVDPGIKWEMIKQDIRETAISYCCYKASERKKRKILLRDKLKKLEKKLACINFNSKCCMQFINKLNPKIDAVKKELEEISAYEIQGVILRSKTKYYELGEKNTKILLCA